MADEKILTWLKENSFGPQEVAGRKIAIFSAPGIGKTVLATRLGKRNLIITDEDGYTSLMNHVEEGTHLGNLNDTWQAVPVPKTGWASISRILAVVESGEFTFYDTGEPFDNVILDTVTGIVSQEIQNIVKAGITPTKGRLTNETASQPDYLVSEQRLIPVMSEIAKMRRCSVTLLFHTRTGDKLTPGDYTRPDVHAAAFKIINKYTSVIAFMYMDAEKKQRVLQVMPNGNGVAAKTRYHFPSEVITDDDFVAHIEKWKAGTK